MLTTTSSAPATFWGCWGCGGCGGCYGNAFSCGGCWGCYGCYGCGGCWGGCYGCYGCGGCWGCGGCYGGGYYAPVAYYGCGCYGADVVAVGHKNGNGKKETGKLHDPQKEEEQSLRQGKSIVVVKAPRDAKIWFDGRLMKRTGVEQKFVTPKLRRGQTYSYEVEATAVRKGKSVTKTEKVLVKAGKRVRLDLGQFKAPKADATARVTVILPADAKLYVDGQACPMKSARRTFKTPKLEPGKSYYYDLEAKVVRNGTTQTARRRVTVKAGAEVTVQLKDFGATQTARR
jgi:uncharacterized protein (TIGR03000 family)